MSPFADEVLIELARRFGTPLYVYDAATIRARVAELAGFDRVRYAQKANPNLAVLRLLRGAGCVVDAVSAGEIERALAAGFTPGEIVFTADLFDARALELVARHSLAVNCGSTDMLDLLAKRRSGGQVTLRLNPGFGHGHHKKVSTGGEESKHGIWHAEIDDAVRRARRLGLEVTGLHVHIGSGTSVEELARAAESLERAAELVGRSLATISAGGGIPVPYRDGEPRFDLARYSRIWRELKVRMEKRLEVELALEVEPGRYLVAESGALVSEVRGRKRQGSIEFVLVDAGFNNLLRPAMYGAFHRIRALGAKVGAARPTIVAGPLCESADVFTQAKNGELAPQMLPALALGDLVAIDDVGAYGMAMASNYNSQPFAAEVLVDESGGRLVRRRQTIEAMLAPELELE